MNTALVELSCSCTHWMNFGPIEDPAAPPPSIRTTPNTFTRPCASSVYLLARQNTGVAVLPSDISHPACSIRRATVAAVVGLQLLHRDHIRPRRRQRLQPGHDPRGAVGLQHIPGPHPHGQLRTGSTGRQRHRACRRPWRWRWSRSWCSAAATTPPRAARAQRGPAPARRPAEHRTATRTAPRCSDLRTLVSDPMGVGAADVATHPPPALRRPVPTRWLRPDGSVQTQLRAASPHV